MKIDLSNYTPPESDIGSPDHIDYYYDRHSRCWIVFVRDSIGNEIESEYSGDKRGRDYSINRMKEEYGLTKVIIG